MTLIADTEPRVIDLGTIDRDADGKFVKTYTLAYEKRTETTGELVRVVRHLPAAGVETIGAHVSRWADEAKAWNIQVLDGTEDVTFDFKCFQD